MRHFGRLSVIALLSACSLQPQLAPAAMGCYALESEPIPEVHRRQLVPEPPTVVRLDTAHGGQVQVPVSWFEAEGLGVRRAELVLLRPASMLVNGAPVALAKPHRPLPPDSLGILFQGGGEGGGGFIAWFSAQPSGDWYAHTTLRSSRAPNVVDVVPMRLRRTTCDSVPLAISR